MNSVRSQLGLTFPIQDSLAPSYISETMKEWPGKAKNDDYLLIKIPSP